MTISIDDWKGKKCPICDSIMNYYEDGVHDTKEYGFCCTNCEVGFYVYHNKKVLKDIKITKTK